MKLYEELVPTLADKFCEVVRTAFTPDELFIMRKRGETIQDRIDREKQLPVDKA